MSLVATACGGRKAAVGRADSAANPWQGEWTFGDKDTAGGYLSIRHCTADGRTCRIDFATYDKGSDWESGCRFGDIAETDPGAQPPLRIVGNRGSVEMGPACSMNLVFDPSQQPPTITASLAGDNCGWISCSSNSHLPANFTLRSKQSYQQKPRYLHSHRCYQDSSPAITEWCTQEEMAALRRGWDALGERAYEISKTGSRLDREDWEEKMLATCAAAGGASRCMREAYMAKIEEFKTQVYSRFLGGKVSADQILKTIHNGFDPLTMKTGQKTDVNGKYSGFGPPRGSRDEKVVSFKIAETSFLPGHVVVLEMLSHAEDGLAARGFFSVVKAEAAGLQVIAHEPIFMGEPSSSPDLTLPHDRSGSSLDFELANYRLNDTERAFGYRLTSWDGGTGADYGDKTVVLFRLTPQALKQVFRAELASHDSEWDNHENKTYKDVESKAIVVVASTVHDGMYDWQVKCSTRNKKAKSRWRPVKTKSYVWKDGQYMLEGK